MKIFICSKGRAKTIKTHFILKDVPFKIICDTDQNMFAKCLLSVCVQWGAAGAGYEEEPLPAGLDQPGWQQQPRAGRRQLLQVNFKPFLVVKIEM